MTKFNNDAFVIYSSLTTLVFILDRITGNLYCKRNKNYKQKNKNYILS